VRRESPGGAAHHLRELGRLVVKCRRRRASTIARAMRRDACSSPTAVDDVGQLALGQAVHEIRGRESLRRVHAHVERALGVEAEPAGGLVELQRAHAHVDEHARRRLPRPGDRGSRGSPRARSARGLRTRPGGRAPARARPDPCRRRGGGRRRAAPQDLAGMAAETDRSVDVQPARLHREQLHRFREEDGLVPGKCAAGHIRSPNPESTRAVVVRERLLLNSRSVSRLWFKTARWFCRPSTLTSPAMAALSRRSWGRTTRPCLSMAPVCPKKFTRSRKRCFEGFAEGTSASRRSTSSHNRHGIDAHVFAGDAG